MNERYKPNMPNIFKKGYNYTDTQGLTEIYYQEIDGLAVFQEDIILGNTESMDKFNAMALSDSLPSVSAARIVGSEWEDRTIPYEIADDAVSVSQIKAAIDYYNQNTEICMRPKTASDTYWVRFIKGDGCASYIGCRKFNSVPQKIWIADWAITGNVIHEIGHCLGLWHEHARQDRDNFVTIRPDLLEDSNYSKYNPSEGIDLAEYDYSSVMHYSRNSEGDDAIVPKNPDAKIGQRNGLSTLDKLGIQSIYLHDDNAPIAELSVISGDATSISAPDGFIKINQDLNQGAGGKYIYICYKKGDSETPITDITVIRGTSPDIKPPDGYSKISVDVNQGADGAYIYICYKKDGSGTPVTNITVLSGDSDDVSNTTGYGYSAVGVDLNAGAGGKYIYLFLQRSNTLPITDVTVVSGKGTEVALPDGYQRVNFDLNDSVGGDYIYACYKRGSEPTGVTDLKVITGDDADVQPPENYSKIPVDLNKGAGGKYIYLCKAYGNSGFITDVIAIGSTWSGIQPPVGYTKINVDLNQGAGGRYVYLCYKK